MYYYSKQIRFDEMSNIKDKFESGKGATMTSKVDVQSEILAVQGGEYENEPQKFEQWQNTTEGGVFENQPAENPDVVKESMKNIGEELPEIGMAKDRLAKFQEIQESSKNYVPHTKRQLTPDRSGKVDYVSEPRDVIEKYQPELQAGVFESNPTASVDMVRSEDQLEDARPEEGSAKNLLTKFKQFEVEAGNRPPPSPGKRELTPDRFTKGEYVSEPRSTFEVYQAPVEAGTFESNPQFVGEVVKSGDTTEEVLPEKGSALSILSKFKEIEKNTSAVPKPQGKRELTPDRTGKVEYVSEPRGVFEAYEGKSESGVFESNPAFVGEVVKSGEMQEENVPEAGFAKNVAAKFKELEKTGTTPNATPPKRQMTPPKEDDRKGTMSGVLESTPTSNPDVIKSTDLQEAELPVKGMAKNIMNRFVELQAQTPPSQRVKKEFTPPPDRGVFENTPTAHLEVEVRQAESGVSESTPIAREDVAREKQETEGKNKYVLFI